MRMAECHPDKKHRAKGFCEACYKKAWLDTGNKRQEHRERTKRFYYMYKQELLDAYGNKCECCGETESVFLELEHKGPLGTGQRHREATGSGFACWLAARREGYPKDKYTLLCANCQRGVLRPEGCPHKRIN
jgi:hypothetical protein